MADNGGENSSRSVGPSINTAATAIGSAETRFPQERRRWRGCWSGFSCFGSQKGRTRIVPASRIPEGNTSANRATGPQPVGISNQATNLTPSLLAPPSSPASFTNSALPSTAQSPSCFLSLSANSPGGPSSNMYATGPYAHETQLVSPPVFSTFTTEPSTAPLTPPPELAHLTTPSSPDVPYARFLSSSVDLKNAGKENGMPLGQSSYVGVTDLQATYPLYPGSPASSLISPVSGTSADGLSPSNPDREFPAQWGASVPAQDSRYARSESSKLFGLDTATSKNFMMSQDSSFFCPATSAQFYLDQAQQSYPSNSHSGGRLSLSREADAYTSGGNGHQNKHSKNCIADAEEIEAYRASFGFSADEIIITPQYVEISDDHVLEDTFTMAPFANNKPYAEEFTINRLPNGGVKEPLMQLNLVDPKGLSPVCNGFNGKAQEYCNGCADSKPHRQSGDISKSGDANLHCENSEDELILKVGELKVGQRCRSSGLSVSDTELDYRRVRSVKDGNGNLGWR